jgi:histidinol-phosphate aminotransferase
VYIVNVAATVAVTAAIEDQDHVRNYVGEVTRSKALVYEMCNRLGLKYWPSAANFVLVHVGPGVARLVAAAAERGVYLRDRSNEPGCQGCVRITAGVVEHTIRGLAVVEELLCAAR